MVSNISLGILALVGYLFHIISPYVAVTNPMSRLPTTTMMSTKHSFNGSFFIYFLKSNTPSSHSSLHAEKVTLRNPTNRNSNIRTRLNEDALTFHWNPFMDQTSTTTDTTSKPVSTAQPSLTPLSTARPSGLTLTHSLSISPSAVPTQRPSTGSTIKLSTKPTMKPTISTTIHPTVKFSRKPTLKFTALSTLKPSNIPSLNSSLKPIAHRTTKPTTRLSAMPVNKRSTMPSAKPSTNRSAKPTVVQISTFSNKPSSRPSDHPLHRPSLKSTFQPTRSTLIPSTLTPSGKPTNSTIYAVGGASSSMDKVEIVKILVSVISIVALIVILFAVYRTRWQNAHRHFSDEENHLDPSSFMSPTDSTVVVPCSAISNDLEINLRNPQEVILRHFEDGALAMALSDSTADSDFLEMNSIVSVTTASTSVNAPLNSHNHTFDETSDRNSSQNYETIRLSDDDYDRILCDDYSSDSSIYTFSSTRRSVSSKTFEMNRVHQTFLSCFSTRHSGHSTVSDWSLWKCHEHSYPTQSLSFRNVDMDIESMASSESSKSSEVNMRKSREFTIDVPQIPLGLIIESSGKGPRILYVKSSSPFLGLIREGDIIVQVDGHPTVDMSSYELSQFIHWNGTADSRRITFRIGSAPPMSEDV